MATLTLSVGGVVSEATATNENATRVLQGALRFHDYDLETMTAQEQSSAVVVFLVEHIQSIAKQFEIADAINTAELDYTVKTQDAKDAHEYLSVAGLPVTTDPPLWGGE